MRNRLTRPSPALVISIVALFVALGGTGYAAVQFPKASVGAKQLKKNSVSSAKVKNGALLLGDFKASERSKLHGARRGLAERVGSRGCAGWPGAGARRRERRARRGRRAMPGAGRMGRMARMATRGRRGFPAGGRRVLSRWWCGQLH